MTNKYNVGDKVLVRKDLEYDYMYYMSDREEFDWTTSEHMRHRGKIVTIAVSDGDGYAIEEDDEEYNWTDEMFAGVANNIRVAKELKKDYVSLYF